MPNDNVARMRREDSLVLRALYDWQLVGRYMRGDRCEPLPQPDEPQKHHFDRVPLQLDKVPDYLLVAELAPVLSEKAVVASLKSLVAREYAVLDSYHDHFSSWVLPDGRSLATLPGHHVHNCKLSGKGFGLAKWMIPKPSDSEAAMPVGPIRTADGRLQWSVVVAVDGRVAAVRTHHEHECGAAYRIVAGGIAALESVGELADDGKAVSDNGKHATKARRHRPDSGNKLKADAKRTFVRQFLEERGGWDGTLEALSAELKKKGVPASAPTLSRYLEGTKYHRKGKPRRSSKGKGEREAVADDEGPADLSGRDAWTMPEDADESIS